jgi:hypothetical protein
VAELHVRQMSHGFGWWRSRAKLQAALSTRPACTPRRWDVTSRSRQHLPRLSRVLMPLCLPAAAGFCRASSMRVPGRRQRISPHDTHATRRLYLTFGSDSKPSLPIFPPDKGRRLLCLGEKPSSALFLPRKGEGPSYFLPS